MQEDVQEIVQEIIQGIVQEIAQKIIRGIVPEIDLAPSAQMGAGDVREVTGTGGIDPESGREREQRGIGDQRGPTRLTASTPGQGHVTGMWTRGGMRAGGHAVILLGRRGSTPREDQSPQLTQGTASGRAMMK